MGCGTILFSIVVLVALFVIGLSTYPKLTQISAAVFAVLALLGVSYLVDENRKSGERSQARLEAEQQRREAAEREEERQRRFEEDRRSAVLVSVAYSSSRCTKGNPIAVTVINKSESVVDAVNVQLAAFLPGRSTNLLTHDAAARLTFDVILEPSREATLCYAVPYSLNRTAVAPAKLLWQLENPHPVFR